MKRVISKQSLIFGLYTYSSVFLIFASLPNNTIARKIVICFSEDLFIRSKSLAAEPFLQVWKQETVTADLNLENMLDKEAIRSPQFMELFVFKLMLNLLNCSE